jgi:hypothetical protein
MREGASSSKLASVQIQKEACASSTKTQAMESHPKFYPSSSTVSGGGTNHVVGEPIADWAWRSPNSLFKPTKALLRRIVNWGKGQSFRSSYQNVFMVDRNDYSPVLDDWLPKPEHGVCSCVILGFLLEPLAYSEAISPVAPAEQTGQETPNVQRCARPGIWLNQIPKSQTICHWADP